MKQTEDGRVCIELRAVVVMVALGALSLFGCQQPEDHPGITEEEVMADEQAIGEFFAGQGIGQQQENTHE